MLRMILGVIGGFVAWVIAWVGSEKILALFWPAFGTHQEAFQAAIENGGEFKADSRMLLVHIVLGPLVSLLAGYLAALIARDNKLAPLILGCLLLAIMGLLKAYMSWPYVPIWYHVVFTALLLPMTILGGKLLTTT